MINSSNPLSIDNWVELIFSQSSTNDMSDGLQARLQERKISIWSDLTKPARNRLWTHWFGTDTLKAPCPICRERWVWRESAGFHAAHIVPRCRWGNNTATWNRLPCCPSCNNLGTTMNLLDYIYLAHPQQLVTICQTLSHQWGEEKQESGWVERFMNHYDDPSLDNKKEIAAFLRGSASPKG